MSVIGEYVHYHASTYVKHGVTRKDESPVNIGTWNQIKNNLLSKIKTIHGDKKIINMEKRFNKFYLALTNINNADYEEARKNVISYIMKNSKDKAKINENTVFNFATGNVYNLQTAKTEISKVSNKVKQIKHKTDKSVSYASTVLKRITAARDQLSGILNSQKKQDILDQLENIEKELKEIDEISQAQLKILAANGVNINEKIISKKTADEYINKINIALGLADGVNLNNAKGEFVEALAAVVNLAAKGQAYGALGNLNDEISSKGGSKHTKTKVINDFVEIDKSIRDSISGFNEAFNSYEGGYSLKITSSQQKMDAEFTYNKQSIPLSIKNYNLSSGKPIHLLKGMPLSSVLFSLEDKNITNHFLNIFSVKTSGGSKKHSYGVDISNMKQMAIEALSIWLLYVAASGRESGKIGGFAEVLLINDNSKKGGIKMYDIGSLTNRVAQNYKNLGSSVDIEPDLTSMYFENKYLIDNNLSQENLIAKRLGTLLASVHKKKISVAIKPSLLKK